MMIFQFCSHPTFQQVTKGVKLGGHFSIFLIVTLTISCPLLFTFGSANHTPSMGVQVYFWTPPPTLTEDFFEKKPALCEKFLGSLFSKI